MRVGLRACRGRRAFGFALGLVWLWSGFAVGADGIEPIGVSIQGAARGGAETAVGDSALSQIDNPATMTLFSKNTFRFDLAGGAVIPRSDWEAPIETDTFEVGAMPLMNLALVIPKNDRLAFGFAVYTKSHVASRYSMKHLLLRRRHRRVGADMRNYSVPFNIAYRLTDKLSVGGGLRAEFGTAKFRTVNGSMAAKFGRGYTAGAGGQLGLHYQMRPDLAFGLGYRSPTWFHDSSGGDAGATWTGDAETSMFGLRAVTLGKSTIENIRLPQKVTAGVAWDATDWLKLIGEVRWIDYSASTFHEAEFVTGRTLEMGLTSPLGYRDQWAFITGAEFSLSEHWKLGVGYHYATNPISRKKLLPIAAAITQHHITTGLRYERDKWWVGGAYVLGLPNAMSGAGRSGIPLGVDFGRSTIEQTEHTVMVGFGLGW